MNQPTLFDQPPVVHKKTNYSYETSLPALLSNKEEKQRQEDRVLHLCRTLPEATIKQIAEVLEIPDATVSARVNRLREKNLIRYDGMIKYKGMLRKRIVII